MGRYPDPYLAAQFQMPVHIVAQSLPASRCAIAVCKTDYCGRHTDSTNRPLSDLIRLRNGRGVDYVERFCNPTRGHSPLDYLSPMDFEQQARVA
jgi:hypothetical protein